MKWNSKFWVYLRPTCNINLSSMRTKRSQAKAHTPDLCESFCFCVYFFSSSYGFHFVCHVFLRVAYSALKSSSWLFFAFDRQLSSIDCIIWYMIASCAIPIYLLCLQKQNIHPVRCMLSLRINSVIFTCNRHAERQKFMWFSNRWLQTLNDIYCTSVQPPFIVCVIGVFRCMRERRFNGASQYKSQSWQQQPQNNDQSQQVIQNVNFYQNFARQHCCYILN